MDDERLFETEEELKAKRYRAPDLSFEALVEVTDANVANERGALNSALREIREAEPEMADEDLALLIKLRAEEYLKNWPEMSITATALSKHWNRISAETERRHEKKVTPIRDERVTICPTCGGDRMVTVNYRPSLNPNSLYEEAAPCPDCNPQSIGWWHFDGSYTRTPEPDEVRRLLNQ